MSAFSLFKFKNDYWNICINDKYVIYIKASRMKSRNNFQIQCFSESFAPQTRDV